MNTLYAKYLLADRITKLIEEAGATPSEVVLTNEGQVTDPTWSGATTVSVSATDVYGPDGQKLADRIRDLLIEKLGGDAREITGMGYRILFANIRGRDQSVRVHLGKDYS